MSPHTSTGRVFVGPVGADPADMTEVGYVDPRRKPAAPCLPPTREQVEAAIELRGLR